MKRALYLSTLGGPRVSPNPFVGAVIVAQGTIIGEGYHRKYGEAHAEVNAVSSVKESDRHLLKESSMYVTLEPCSHFGKTPPCADLILREGIPHVVVAAPDPFLKNYDSGIERLRANGVRVDVGLLRKESEWINRRFFTAHTLRRPFVLLKWAQSADGFIAGPGGRQVSLSNPFSLMLMHRERSFYDAIMVGTNTVLNDDPSLSCRLWPCRDNENRPLKVTFDSRSLTGSSKLERGHLVKMSSDESLDDFLHRLYEQHKVTSLMVEGGARTLDLFLHHGLFDEVRIEYSSVSVRKGIPAPSACEEISRAGLSPLPPETYDGNTVKYFVKNN